MTSNRRGQGLVSVLVSELITQEQIVVEASNLVEGLFMSPAPYEHVYIRQTRQ